MWGFGKAAGPAAAPPPSHPSFGNYPSPPTPSPPALPPPTFPNSAPPRSPGRAEAVPRVLSPSSTFESTKPAATPSYPLVGLVAHRHVDSSSRVANEQRSFFRKDVPENPRPSATTSFVASRNSGSSITAKISRFQDPKRTQSPPSVRDPLDSLVDYGNQFVPSRTRSPHFVSQNYYVDHDRLLGEGQRAALSPPAGGLQSKMPRTYSNFLASEDQSSVSPVVGSLHSRGSLTTEAADVQASKQTRSSLIPASSEIFLENNRFLQKEFSRPSISPPMPVTGQNASFSTFHSQFPQRSVPSVNTAIEAVPTKVAGFSVAKRTRSPPKSSTDEVFPGNSHSTQDDSEREIQAKAKRLARFKKELTEGFETVPDVANKKVSAMRSEQSMVETQISAGDHNIGSREDFTSGLNSSDLEGLGTSSIIVGLCPDMCPESERMERERKGDLDKYERVDGDRNQTNKYLAVKKYNRTAEREASLIRPMPILQKTIDYLLNLLDQPYGDGFLVLYNFLWDRMRAIRMDLRMQHIFNLKAITMLEQMIRLHIIAMHELCEYTKGEGFSEGFDAHLNIEQMNKTSVELFQMYDDHRKKGIHVPTEKEFRGYYALLKLDKHPGYKVEPAELSLDLAKMTPEMRQTPEVLFARNVARACRTGNFIAFFRLARKASYLQACLMHAHFAKLRTQALSSLHAGLQSNQGLPVADIAKWLAMEDEDIESLLEYHGLLIKEFEEPYMVKEGPFLNSDKDYPTNYSKLVQLKKSRRIVDDVAQTPQLVSVPAEATKEVWLPKINKHATKTIRSVVDRKMPIRESNEEVPNFEVFQSPKAPSLAQPVFGKSILSQDQHVHQEPGAQISSWGPFLAHSSLETQSPELSIVEKTNHEAFMAVSPKRKMPSGTERMSSDMESTPLQIVSRSALQERSLSGKFNRTLEEVNSQIKTTNNLQDVQLLDINIINKSSDVMEDYEDEVARAKLKLILRLWRRRSSKRRELREQRQITASAALSLLSLGPPIQQARDQASTHSQFDIDHIMRERYENHEKSWSRLNVSDVVADILGRRNPGAKCLCWKIVICSQMNHQGEKEKQRSEVMHGAASLWLLSKLMPSRENDYDDNNELLLSFPGLSIWRRWASGQFGDDLICCFSVVKDVKFDNLSESISGASAVLFLVSESIPWNLQRMQLHHLLISIPYGSALPLLVLSGSHNREVSDPSSIIVHELGLHDIDKSRVGSFSIVFLVEDKQMESFDGFFSDKKLREGLQWLASEAPLQPDLCCIKPLELVLTNLNPSLDFLEKISHYEIRPNHCISAFNESLNWSAEEISATAKANPVGWPCPEISLLEDLSAENMLVKWCLPSTGWSSATRIEPLICALRNCKLPTFPVTDWLDKGAYPGNEIETQLSQLEDCLIRYLTESSGMMGLPLAKKEAHLMLQRSTRLELSDSSYHIIPKWIVVFRRIFNWRLSALSNGPWAFVYVPGLRHQNPTSQILEDLDVDGIVPSPFLSPPSLDELIYAGFGSDLTRCQLQPEAYQTLASTVSKGNADVDANSREDEKTSGQNGYSSATDNFHHVTSELHTTSTEIVVAGKPTKEADKLSKLLEQCNIVLNSIDNKLYIYF